MAITWQYGSLCGAQLFMCIVWGSAAACIQVPMFWKAIGGGIVGVIFIHIERWKLGLL